MAIYFAGASVYCIYCNASELSWPLSQLSQVSLELSFFIQCKDCKAYGYCIDDYWSELKKMVEPGIHIIIVLYFIVLRTYITSRKEACQGESDLRCLPWHL